MYLEHAVWTLTVCVLAGMFYANYPRNRNPVWIIWFAMLIPDSDFIAQTVWENVFPYKTTVLFIHGQFHNILVFTFSILVIGWFIWRYTKISYRDAAICVGIGFIAHLLEDALVNGVEYHFYFPISNRGWYQGYILTPADDVIFANSVYASSNIAAIGFCLLVLAIILRCNLQGYNWLEKFNPYPWMRRTWITVIKPGLITFYTTDILLTYGFIPYEEPENQIQQKVINGGQQWTNQNKRHK